MHCIQKHPLWHLLVLLWISNKEFDDTKGVIRILKSKDRQHNGQKKDKMTNDDLQNIHIKLKIE